MGEASSLHGLIVFTSRCVRLSLARDAIPIASHRVGATGTQRDAKEVCPRPTGWSARIGEGPKRATAKVLAVVTVPSHVQGSGPCRCRGHSFGLLSRKPRSA